MHRRTRTITQDPQQVLVALLADLATLRCGIPLPNDGIQAQVTYILFHSIEPIDLDKLVVDHQARKFPRSARTIARPSFRRLRRPP